MVDGRLLLAQRSRPPQLVGLWELPGGKVETDESPQHALARELREELGIETSVGEQLRGEVSLAQSWLLRAYRVELIAGTPTPLEHSDLRWVDARELGEMDLVDADREWVPELSGMLTQPEPS